MTARDRWTIDLKCPDCGREGVAHVSQEDGWSFQHDQSTRVDSVSPGFRVDYPDGKPDFYCKADGAKAG